MPEPGWIWFSHMLWSPLHGSIHKGCAGIELVQLLREADRAPAVEGADFDRGSISIRFLPISLAACFSSMGACFCSNFISVWKISPHPCLQNVVFTPSRVSAMLKTFHFL